MTYNVFGGTLNPTLLLLSASDSFLTMALYKSIYLLTYLLTYFFLICSQPSINDHGCSRDVAI